MRHHCVLGGNSNREIANARMEFYKISADIVLIREQEEPPFHKLFEQWREKLAIFLSTAQTACRLPLG